MTTGATMESSTDTALMTELEFKRTCQMPLFVETDNDNQRSVF